MKPLFYLLIIFAIFFPWEKPVFADCAVTSLLTVGSKGAEVQCLQTKVGAVPDGSFGPLTQVAVQVFQLNNGLKADGVVGPLTHALLNGADFKYPPGCLSLIGYSPTTGVKCDSKGSLEQMLPEKIKPVENINPNIAKLHEFIETVVEVSRKNGSSEKELKIIADTLRKEVMNSDMDFNEEFKSLLIRESNARSRMNVPSVSVFDEIISKTLSFFGVTPSVAHAQAAGTPFGGALLFPFFCPLSGNWMIGIQPLPPTFVTLLSYFPGTQGFASWNIPFTRFLLGSYEPGGVCVIPAVPTPITIPTQGTITPMVGSSPLPL